MSRAKYRLELARRLIELPVGGAVMVHIDKLTTDARAHLRGLVDWVEEYERHEGVAP